MAIEKFNLVLDESYNICPTIKHLSLHRDDGKSLDFIPGQFITFLFNVDGKTKRRSYSIASLNTDKIEIAVSHVDGGIATEHLFGMKPGDQFPAMGPAGRLILQDDGLKRYILVGTGTGIAPYRAMLPALAERISGADFKVEIVLGARHRCDLLYQADFMAFCQTHTDANYQAQLSREDLAEASQAHEFAGYVQSSFDRLNLKPGEDAIYLCGNPDMIDECYADLEARGFESKDIRREKYISSN